MGMTRLTKTFAGLGLLLSVVSLSAVADSSVTLNDTLDYNGQAIVLDMEVGTAQLIATDESEVRIEVVVKPSDSNWFGFWSNSDISGVALAINEGQDKIVLKLSEQDDLSQEWRVYLPREAAIAVEAGVGEVVVDGFVNNIDVDLGVGRAEVAHQGHYGDVSLESGVGEVSISKNGQHQAIKRSLVSASYHSKDEASKQHLYVNVGVGEIDINN
ncbi:hypothetical protein [Shewanella colwelliana]|uniref:hypothetical protein n=1 Tax=Shewanella colwelliana TaxID=23 RepID=UPI0022B0036D|nr:hypothetical protein [Shewanella colwelliana]MCZ4337473.1 hypothetical protein [Shewanella colwelliana]